MKTVSDYLCAAIILILTAAFAAGSVECMDWAYGLFLAWGATLLIVYSSSWIGRRAKWFAVAVTLLLIPHGSAEAQTGYRYNFHYRPPAMRWHRQYAEPWYGYDRLYQPPPVVVVYPGNCFEATYMGPTERTGFYYPSASPETIYNPFVPAVPPWENDPTIE